MRSHLFEARLEYIAHHSACQRTLRSLEGARAESMMRCLHRVGSSDLSVSVFFLTFL
jgi:hypothetical protein